jgi:hypothetical protein
MIALPENRSSSSTPSRVIVSSDTEFQIQDEIVIEAKKIREVKLNAMRRITEYVVAVASLLFLGTAAQTFLPSTTRLVESSFAAAGTSFLTLLKGI